VRDGSSISALQSRLNPLRAWEAIEELRRCRTLPKDLRLDSDCDRRVERVVRGLMQAGPAELAELRRLADPDEVALLLEWSDRASSLAVRRGDPDLLVEAVFAFGFAESAAAPMWVHLQSQLRHAARIIERDPDEAWASAMARSDEQGAAWLDANRGRRRFARRAPHADHFSDPYDGGRFRFGREPSASLRGPLASTPSGVPARPDLSVAGSLAGSPEVRRALEALVGDLWRQRRRDEADLLIHVVLAHDEAAEALNELRAVLSQTGTGGADSRLAAVLERA
jgi:hypothetical protein